MRNRSENQIKLVLIRHGATQSNLEHRYLGKTDESLCEEGIRELRKSKEGGCYPEVEYLFSSSMKRCLETAEILYPNKEPSVIPEWEEMDFGVFEGKNYIELQGDLRYQAWIDSNGTLPFPEGESREEFVNRCDKGLRRMLEQLLSLAGENQSTPYAVGMIAHGGTIMSLLSRYNGGEYFDYQAPNGGGYVCTLRERNRSFEMVGIEKIIMGV